MPDFIGNFTFNSVGNLLVNRWSGLFFLDYARRDLLRLIGTAEVEWDGPELYRYAAARSGYRAFRWREGMWLEGGLPLR